MYPLVVVIGVVALVLGAYFVIYHRLRVEGLQNLVRTGPFMIITNHTSALEFFASLVLATRSGLSPGVNEFTPSKRELLDLPILGRFLRRPLGSVPSPNNFGTLILANPR